MLWLAVFCVGSGASQPVSVLALGTVLLSLYRMRAWDPLIAPRHAQPAASTRAHGASQPGGDGTVRDCVTFKFTAFNFGVQQTMLTATKKWPQPPLRCFSAWGICVCVLPLGSFDHRQARGCRNYVPQLRCMSLWHVVLLPGPSRSYSGAVLVVEPIFIRFSIGSSRFLQTWTAQCAG